MKRPQDDPATGLASGPDLLSVGITFALTVTGFVLLGVWADRRLGTLPLFTVVGVLAGIGLGGFWLYQKVGRTR